PFRAAPAGVRAPDLLEKLLLPAHSASERAAPQKLPPDLLVRRVGSQLRAFGLADIEWGKSSSPLVSPFAPHRLARHCPKHVHFGGATAERRRRGRGEAAPRPQSQWTDAASGPVRGQGQGARVPVGYEDRVVAQRQRPWCRPTLPPPGGLRDVDRSATAGHGA